MSEEMIEGNDMPWRIVEVEANENYQLILTFASGEKKMFDAKQLLENKNFELLKNADFFMKVYVAGDSIAWSDELDIAPEYLYENSTMVN